MALERARIGPFSRHIQLLRDLGSCTRGREAQQRFVYGLVEFSIARLKGFTRRAHEDDDLSFWAGGGVAVREFAKSTGYALLVKLADLAGDGRFPVAKTARERGKHFAKAGPALIEDEGCANRADFGNCISPCLGLGRQEAAKEEPVSRQSRKGQRCDDCRGPGNGVNGMARSARSSDELVAGI